MWGTASGSQLRMVIWRRSDGVWVLKRDPVWAVDSRVNLSAEL